MITLAFCSCPRKVSRSVSFSSCLRSYLPIDYCTSYFGYCECFRVTITIVSLFCLHSNHAFQHSINVSWGPSKFYKVHQLPHRPRSCTRHVTPCDPHHYHRHLCLGMCRLRQHLVLVGHLIDRRENF